MRWEEFLTQFRQLPIINTELMLSGIANPGPVKVQISRWAKAGKLIQLKRGYYLFPEVYRKTSVNILAIAAVLKNPSYISLEKALEYHGLIPEAVHVITSVTTKRPVRYTNSVGTFDYRHIKQSLFWGYNSVAMNGQTAFVACAEKALLDFFYLRSPKISKEFVSELRLQNLGCINRDKMLEFAARFHKTKIMEAAKLVEQQKQEEKKTERKL